MSDLLTVKVTDHLVEQARAGVQLLQLFESSAEYLNLKLFKEYAFPCLDKICTQVKKRLAELNITNVPIIVFAKGAHYAMEFLTKEQNKPDKVIDVLSLDWTMEPEKIRAETKLCLQGNMDPCYLYCDAAEIDSKVKDMISKFGAQNYIANLGHGIYPDAKISSVEAFINSVHKFKID